MGEFKPFWKKERPFATPGTGGDTVDVSGGYPVPGGEKETSDALGGKVTTVTVRGSDAGVGSKVGDITAVSTSPSNRKGF